MTDSNLDEAMDTSEETEGENSNDKSNPDFKDNDIETSSNPVKTKDSTETYQTTSVPCTSQDQSPITEENEESREKGFNSKLDDNPDSREAPEPSNFDLLCMSMGDKPTRMEDKWTDTVERHKETNKDLGTTEVIQEDIEKQNLFKRLHLDRCQKNLRAANVLQISAHSLHFHCAEQELVQTFIQNLLMIDYRARFINAKVSPEQYQIQKKDNDLSECDIFADFFENKSLYEKGTSQSQRIDPMDLQMAVFHCADGFLKQLMVTKLAQCQYALPLLVPDPFTRQIEFPLWTFRQINKSWKMRNTDSDIIGQTQPIYKAKTPMVFFFRFGSVSSSKSQVINSLINEKHNTFFHRNCPGSSRNRLLMDGVVEIAWYCPSGTNDDKFTDCVAFCNLHGDAGEHEKQLEILTEMSSVNVVFLPQMDRNDRHAAQIQNLYKSSKPLICLFTEDESAVTKKTKAEKFKIGLKHRNQSDVSEEIRKAINACLSPSSSSIILKDVFKHSDIRVDEEDDDDCRRGRKAAQKMMNLLENRKLIEIKVSLLSCQKLWHQWSQKNKELHRPQGDKIEMEISLKTTEMKEIRKEQHKSNFSQFMKLFIKEMMSNAKCEKLFFLKWLRILLDEHTSVDLSKLHHKYDTTLSAVLKLKEKNDKYDVKLKIEKTKLEKISEYLQAATFGLEHIMREIGQIYESCKSVNKNKEGLPCEFTFLPSIAAEMMISGFPLELMDGDAAHVPVVWVTAVIQELIQKLGDQRVFVLSVLGLQSSGKSTMLNAMFGLQFAVSAGRCTRGAFMQLVRVSDEMKTDEMKIDYILVVDTEGLRALELSGRSTRHHDNELATFVVGLGHLTLINIFGENPSEMQDILQIVVQAFMRMKQVKLNPSCVFVHQNVSDVTAGEKNMEGRRRLQEKLDEMTKLAAKEEDSDAGCFSDVIKFDIQKDVKYFAQLWEGNPPMAPPNPKYCTNIQELKNTVFSKATCVTLSQFNICLKNLWNALLNENFVFSFKNILEIAVYRRLETKYNKWTWKLRSTIIKIEEKFNNRIDNGKDEVKINDLLSDMNETKEAIQKSLVSYFEEDRDKEILSQWRGRFEIKITELHDSLIKRAKQKLDEVIEQKKAREKLDGKKKEYENKLFSLSKELALLFKNTTDEHVLKKEFDSVWSTWITDLIEHTPPVRNIDIWNDVTRILSESHELTLLQDRQKKEYYKKITLGGDCSYYIMLKKNVELNDQDLSHRSSEENSVEQKEMSVTAKSRFTQFFSFGISYLFRRQNVKNKLDEPQSENNTLEQNITLLPEDCESVRVLIRHIIDRTSEILEKTQTAKVGYHDGYIQEMTECVQNNIGEYQNKNKKFQLKKEFTVDLCLHVCDSAHDKFTVLHNEFRNAKDPRIYLEKQKPQYHCVFMNYCRGATTTTIFAEFICSKLESSILQAVYNQSAIGLSDLMMSDIPALNGNRSKLEKHILKSLAEKENFEDYMKYIHNPREHFKCFISHEVDEFIKQHHQKVLTIFNRNLTLKAKAVNAAVHKSIVEVKGNCGDAFTWQKLFTHTLSEELKFTGNSCADLSEITDFDFLEKLLSENLRGIISNLQDGLRKIEDIKMEKCRKKPDELLINHLCQCCWVQCPFCGVICTNTIENHTEDHSVAFHRNIGLNGWFYRGTTNLSISICTSAVASDRSFHPDSSENTVPWKAYRKGGAKYSNWSITPDFSELPYWKWFVCRFQKDLEKYYNKTFEGKGLIPDEWREHSKDEAVQSLDEYI